MARYTRQNLEHDVAELNIELTKAYEKKEPHSRLYFIVGCRNGYTAIDLATKSDLARHVIYTNLKCGTPRECRAAAGRFLSDQF